jgi:quercetin dioxygenase-like cupin family protein
MEYTKSRLEGMHPAWAVTALMEKSFNSAGCSIALQAIPAGAAKSQSPRYHRHPEEQVIYLLEGEFDVLLPEGAVRMQAGDVLAIPGNVIHGARRENDGGLLMLNIFTPRRPDDFTHRDLKMYDTIEEVP